jgi:DNA-binding HxlR family transcriptional regulator
MALAEVCLTHLDEEVIVTRPGQTDSTYGNFCGIARAFEIIGAPWSALIVRDLLLGGKSVAELRESLPTSTPEVVRERLADLAAAGVVAQTGDDAYSLTDYGRDLEPILLKIGLWGARSLGDLRLGDVFTLDMAILALRTTFRPEEARGLHVSFEVWFGPIVVNVQVADGELTVAEGELPGADLVISSQLLKHLMAEQVTPADVLWLGLAETKGDPELLDTFVRLFHIPPAPDLPE